MICNVVNVVDSLPEMAEYTWSLDAEVKFNFIKPTSDF